MIAIFVEILGCSLKNSISIYLPQDIEEYRHKAALSVQEGNVFHLSDFSLIAESITIPKTGQYTAVIEATTAALLNVSLQGTVCYFLLENRVAYVVLKMDEGGWSGVMAAKASVRPLVTYNLLQFEEIDEVRFSYPMRTRY
jgi:hypothetical protein